MARAPQARPALAGNFRIDLGRGADAQSITQVILPRFPIRAALAEPDPLLILRRPASGDRLFHDWWDQARSGRAKPRVVTVAMLAPDASSILAWRFTKVRPAALSYGPLDGAAEGLLTETLELGFERMERV